MLDYYDSGDLTGYTVLTAVGLESSLQNLLFSDRADWFFVGANDKIFNLGFQIKDINPALFGELIYPPSMSSGK